MESKMDVILPVVWDITIVADVKRPEMTAREDTSTVIEGPVDSIGGAPLGGDGAGVG
jgi:hypothetical protein